MAQLLLLVSAVAPSILLFWYFRSRDVFPEPPGVLAKSFGLGVLSILPVLMVALPLGAAVGVEEWTNPYAVGAFEAFFLAAIPEEAFKMLMLVAYCARHSEFDEPMDGLVYGATVSLGFATLENVLYSTSGGMGVAILRAFTAVPMHALCGAIMGYFVGMAKFGAERDRRQLWWAAFWVPTLLHGIYDFPLLTFGAAGDRSLDLPGWFIAFGLALAIGTLLLEVWIARRQHRYLRARQFRLRGGENPDQQPRTPATWKGLVAVIGGGLSGSFGALFCLVGVLTLLGFGETAVEDRGPILGGIALLGPGPFLLGIGAFVWGIRELNRAGRLKARQARGSAAPG